MSDFLKNKCINIKWRLKAFQNICGRSFCQYATNTIFSSTIGEESSMIKWMYLAIIYIKYSIYLMKLWDLMFIRPLFFLFFLYLPPYKAFLEKKKTFIMSLLSLKVCVAKMFYWKEIHWHSACISDSSIGLIMYV